MAFFFENDVNVASKSKFLLPSWRSLTKILKQDPETDPELDADPLVRGMDPRIRIHTKMSWIRNATSQGR